MTKTSKKATSITLPEHFFEIINLAIIGESSRKGIKTASDMISIMMLESKTFKKYSKQWGENQK